MVRRNPEVAVAVAMTAGVYLGSLAVARAGEQRPLDWVGVALIAAACAVLAWRRTRPVAVTAVAGAACVAYYALLYPGIFAAAPLLLAVYTVVSRRSWLAGAILAVAYLVTFYLVIAAARGSFAIHDGVLWQAGFLTAVVVIGQMAATHRAYLREVELRAAEAERIRDEVVLRRASEERLWIAQELHDTLTHSISVINVQAGVAAHLIDSDPRRLRPALAAIREAGQEAMRELRGTLGALRRVDEDGPAPGLDGLFRLVARAEAAGLRVAVEVGGEARPLPAAADRAAYRIVQEALTNVLRHASGASVTVRRDYGPHTLKLFVRNDGQADAPRSGHGMGLIGMRERAMAVGGTLVAGPEAEGGFLVEAELPLADRP